MAAWVGCAALGAVAVADTVTDGWGEGATAGDGEGEGALLTAGAGVGGAEVGAGAAGEGLQATSAAMSTAASCGARRVSITLVTDVM